MSRLFAFGCSFTKYKWPTWADILGQEFEYYENWGKPGGGNQYIFNSLNECIVRHSLQPGDTVIIMWTNVWREDRYINRDWVVSGNIITNALHIEMYNENFVKTYIDERGVTIRDFAFINSAKHVLENIGVNYIFLSMTPLTNIDMLENCKTTDIEDIIKAYTPVLDLIRPSIYEKVFNFDWWSRPFLPQSPHKEVKSYYDSVAGSDWPLFIKFFNKDLTGVDETIVNEMQSESKFAWTKRFHRTVRTDMHATPAEHLEYIDLVLPEFTISEETRKWVRQIDSRLRNNMPCMWHPSEVVRW